jgi:hypothetical protein
MLKVHGKIVAKLHLFALIYETTLKACCFDRLRESDVDSTLELAKPTSEVLLIVQTMQPSIREVKAHIAIRQTSSLMPNSTIDQIPIVTSLRKRIV